MKTYSFYHADTGAIHGNRFSSTDPADVELNTPADHIAIEGYHDHLSKRVDVATGELVEHQPPAPSREHEWNEDTKRWHLNAVANDRANRKAAAIARIAQLEASQHRVVREALLGIPGARVKLSEIDDEITSLRSQVGL